MISAKLNALVVLGFAALIVLAKYNLARLPVRPFGFDPCDAVNGFGLFTIALAVMISLGYAFFGRSHLQYRNLLYVLRCQQAFVLAVFITVVAYVADLVRHPPIWETSLSRNEMFTWLMVYAGVALAMQFLTQAAKQSISPKAPNHGMTAGLVLISAALVLLFCPEWGKMAHSSETAHILTVTLGALVLLIPIRLLLPLLIPYESTPKRQNKYLFRTPREWSTLAFGSVVFAVPFWDRLHQLHGVHLHAQAIFGVSGGLLIAYAFLAAPLGMLKESDGAQ